MTEHTLPAYAVIVAGGKGTRMGNALPKQFMDLNGRPVLFYTIQAFLKALPGVRLVLVLPADQISYAQMILRAFPERLDITIIPGGATRFHSVQNGLEGIPAEAVVLVHDGVRPLVSPKLIQACYRLACEKGAVIPVISVTDSIRQVTSGGGSEPVSRDVLRIIQTPQAFRGSVLIPAMKCCWHESFTDEATVVEAAGHPIWLTEGEKDNIKLTTPEDMLIAAALLHAKESV